MVKRLKILAISYLYPNSIYPDYGIFVHNRLKAVNHYCEIKVINPVPWFPFSSLFERYKGYNNIPQKEIIDGIEVIHPRFFIIPRFFKFIDAFTFCAAVFFAAVGLRKQYLFDLIDLHWTYPDLLSGWSLSKLFRKKFLVTIRGKEALNMFVLEDGDKNNGTARNKSEYVREYSPRFFITKHLLKLSNAVITLSHELKEICIEFGVRENSINVITNGIDVEKFHYVPKDIAREQLNMDQDETIILVVGSLIFGKGFDRLLNIIPQLKKDFINLTVYIIGSEGPAGAYKKALLSICEQKGITGSVHFIGQVTNNNMPLWYNAADIFCLSSRGEGSPNVLYEALASGCPCVATDVGSASEILNADSLGVVVSNDDSALLPGIRTALATDYDRKEIAEYMRQHDWDSCARKVVRVYNQLLNGHDQLGGSPNHEN